MKDLSFKNEDIELIAYQYHSSEHRLHDYIETNCISSNQNVGKAYLDIREKIKGELILIEDLVSYKKNIYNMGKTLKEILDLGLPVLVLTDEYGDHPQGSDPFSFYRKSGFKPLLICANGTLMLFYKE